MGRFQALKDVKTTAPAAEQTPAAKSASKRGNPEYQQFSAYLPIGLYRRLKGHLASNGVELSDAVEDAVSAWLNKQEGRG
jgi:hypothetical protein